MRKVKKPKMKMGEEKKNINLRFYLNLENKIRPITYILHGKSFAAFDLIEHLLSKHRQGFSSAFYVSHSMLLFKKFALRVKVFES